MTTRYGDRVPTARDHWVPLPGVKGGFMNHCGGDCLEAVLLRTPEPWRSMIPNPHPAENCGPLQLTLPNGAHCPTCGVRIVVPLEHETKVAPNEQSPTGQLAGVDGVRGDDVPADPGGDA